MIKSFFNTMTVWISQGLFCHINSNRRFLGYYLSYFQSFFKTVLFWFQSIGNKSFWQSFFTRKESGCIGKFPWPTMIPNNFLKSLHDSKVRTHSNINFFYRKLCIFCANSYITRGSKIQSKTNTISMNYSDRRYITIFKTTCPILEVYS